MKDISELLKSLVAQSPFSPRPERPNPFATLLGGSLLNPTLGSPNPFGTLLDRSLLLPRRKAFISYHHEIDQGWADSLGETYGDRYELFYDSSLDDEVDSDDPKYVDRVIREDWVIGTSITIVLCGSQTYKRRYIDWEIRSTLFHEHALLGIRLPTAMTNAAGQVIVPHRFNDNYWSGYAHWMTWPVSGDALLAGIEVAEAKSAQASLIRNARRKMRYNLP